MKTKLHNEKTRYLLGLSGQNILYALVSSCFAYYLQFTILIPALLTIQEPCYLIQK